MPGRTEVVQLHEIFKLCGSPSEDYWIKSKLHKSKVFKPLQPYRRRLADTFKYFTDAAVGLMETLLSIDPAHRGTAAFALRVESEFFTIKPHACDPSSLPKYPPSKEIDAKLRDEEARRQGAAGIRGQTVDGEIRGSKESRDIPAPDANAELVTSMQAFVLDTTINQPPICPETQESHHENINLNESIWGDELLNLGMLWNSGSIGEGTSFVG